MSDLEIGELQDNELTIENTNNLDWINQRLYDSGTVTLGEIIYKILKNFFSNSLTKKSLQETLILLDCVVLHPNNLPKPKYQFSKLLDTLLASTADLIIKHQICRNFSHYLANLVKLQY